MWTLFLSLKYFFSKRKEGMISLIGIISVLGVALGVASLIIVLSVMNGFDRELKDKIIGTYAHVIVMREGGIENHEELAAEMESMSEVEKATGFITGQAVLKNEDSVLGILLKGVDVEKEAEVSEVIKYASGAHEELVEDTIILGSELMKSENLYVGDTVELMVPYSLVDIEKAKLKIVGEFTSGRYDYDANIGIVNMPTAQKFYRLKNAVSGLGLKIKEEWKANTIRDRLQENLRYPYRVKSWMDLDRNLVNAIALEKKMMFLILALIVMVACFNIAGSLIMMVMEKTRDIGILKAIGANSFGISLVFLFEGFMVGAVGVLLGGSAGMFIAKRVNVVAGFIERITGIALFPSDVYYFTEIPVQINMPDVYTIIITALVLSLIAGIYPAWKASRMVPVEAIRYE